jgi:hypothetical protein
MESGTNEEKGNCEWTRMGRRILKSGSWEEINAKARGKQRVLTTNLH